MQQRGYLVRLNKMQNFFHALLFCSKVNFCSANLTSKVNFFNEIVRVANSTNACELTEYRHGYSLSRIFIFSVKIH